MARYSFSTFNNNEAMSSVRTKINNNFTAAMAKPLDGTTPLDAGSNTVYLVAIATDGTTYTMSSTKYLAATGTANGANLSLTGNLTVNGNTTLGDARADTITLNGTVANLSGAFTSLAGGNITSAGTINASTINASTINVSSLNVGGSAYSPIIISPSVPTGTGKGYYLWVNTSASVPVLNYCTTSNPTASTHWKPIGAVFG